MNNLKSDRSKYFKNKYGTKVIDNGMRLRPDDFLDEVEWRDSLDQHFTKSWLDFTYGGLFDRKGIDDKTRVLVSIAQFLAMNEIDEFEKQILSALNVGAHPREILEIILQSTVYIGYVRAARGAKIFKSIIEKLGRIDEIADTQLPIEGRLKQRSLIDERLKWPIAKNKEEENRREELLNKYGWKGVSTRIRTQNHQSNETINNYDKLDPHYLQLWFDFIYGELYPRGIIDDRTRLLMMVGICLALNEPIQLANHIRGALLLGSNVQEILEIIVNSTAYVGMPTTVQIVGVLIRIANEEGYDI